MSMQFRLEINPLTVPPSYWIRFVPRNTADETDIAADVAAKYPNFSQEVVEAILNAADEAILLRLLNGEQVSKKGGFRYTISFTGRLDSPDAPLPPLDECLQIVVHVSPIFLAALRQQAHTTRLPMAKKLPLITSAFDTILKLNDVLNAQGVLQVIGEDLFFDEEAGTGECVIEGTNNGRAVQTRFVSIANNAIQIMPDIPSQTQPWHNEYRLTVSTHYTEHGTLRTGIYARMLRTPLGVRIGDNPGILSTSGTVPLVTVTGGALSAEGARVRIQVVYNVQDSELRFSLLDMKEGGKVGDDVRVAANGVYTLPGYTGGDVTNMEVTVADYAALLAMVRSPYGGRLVDILDVSMGS
jgi:hypothetical protein